MLMHACHNNIHSDWINISHDAAFILCAIYIEYLFVFINYEQGKQLQNKIRI